MEKRFPDSKALLQFLKEKSDDIDGVTVMVTNNLPLSGPQGQTSMAKNCCSTLKMCNGETILIHREEMEILINDGILQKLNIPISLLPRVAE